MKKILFALIIISGSLNAQQFKIKGQIENRTHKAIASANILIYSNHGSSLIKVVASDTSGKFQLNGINKGSYYLRIESIGFLPYQSNLLEVQDNIDLAPIVLENAAKELKGITITGKKSLIEILPDKTVFNVSSSLNATGLNAFDVLRKAPGVIIDNSDNLIVEGKSGVRIYIDNKISLLSGDDLIAYLKTLQSSDLEAVEIITQPSSKYDAAGSAGIINLRLKKNKNYGTNGSLTLGYAIGQFGKYNSSLTLNNRNSIFNIYANYSNSFGQSTGFVNLDRFQSGFEYNQHSSNIDLFNRHNIRAGIDYLANKNNTLGIVLTGNFSGDSITNKSRTPIINSQSDSTLQILDAYSFTRSTNNNLGLNVNYRFDDKKGHELSFDGDYGNYHSFRNNLQPNYYYNNLETVITSQSIYRMNTPVTIQLLSAKADYSQALLKMKLAVGLKVSTVKTGNIFNFYDVNSGAESFNYQRSNNFSYSETIKAAYFNLSKSWEKLSLQIGLRTEQTISDGELTSAQQNTEGSVKRNYLDFFPSGGLTYKLNLKNSLAITYSKRVERPDYRSLNPFIYNVDELSFSKGNPFLKPQYTDAIKISHTYNYSINSSLTYSFIRDFFAQITDTLGKNSNFISPQNIANEQIIDLGFSYPFDVNKWWSVYASVNAYRSFYNAVNSKFIAITQNTFSLYGQNTFSLPEGYHFEVSGWFSSPSIWAGTYKTHSLGSLDFALQKVFLKNRLTLRASISDLLYTSNWKGTTRYGVLFINGSGGYESRQFRFGLTYNFGRKEIQKSEQRDTGAEDEKERIKN
jgi:iron complex outermembrane receptor protein